MELGKEIIRLLDAIKSKLFDLEDILLDLTEDEEREVGGIW